MPASAVERLAGQLSELADAPAKLERPQDPAHGDYATNVALQAAPRHRRPPREFAAELAEKAAALDEVERAEVAGPGFVNVWLKPAWFGEALAEIGPDYGRGEPEHAQKIQVELVSANPAGPLTVGSARNGAYGDSVARLLAYAGHDVEREYYFNDAGRQLELFRASVEARRRGEEPPEDGYRGAYIADLAGEDGDPVPAMLARIEATLERLRIHYDSWARQSELEQRLPEFLPRLDTYEADGALWARSSAYGDEQDRVLIRSPDRGGAPTYRAADVVYLADKLDRGFDRAVYVLGADHHGTRRWYAAVARMLGYDPERIEVLLYQLVHLTRSGERARGSKRSGDAVELTEFLDEVGV
ncbi:MAG: arginine--tRNA ligase, partial [Gaiellaceae bacterium]